MWCQSQLVQADGARLMWLRRRRGRQRQVFVFAVRSNNRHFLLCIDDARLREEFSCIILFKDSHQHSLVTFTHSLGIPRFDYISVGFICVP